MEFFLNKSSKDEEFQAFIEIYQRKFTNWSAKESKFLLARCWGINHQVGVQLYIQVGTQITHCTHSYSMYLLILTHEIWFDPGCPKHKLHKLYKILTLPEFEPGSSSACNTYSRICGYTPIVGVKIHFRLPCWMVTSCFSLNDVALILTQVNEIFKGIK